MVPSADLRHRQPRCVQMEVKALNSPRLGWVTTVLVAAMILPPPTGMSALAMPASPPEPLASRRRAAAPLLELPPARSSCCESLPQAASAVAPRAATPTAPPADHGTAVGVCCGGVLVRIRAWLVLRGPDGVGSPLLEGGTSVAPLRFTRWGPASGRMRRAAPARRRLCEGGAARVCRARDEQGAEGWTRGAYDAFTAALQGVAGRPARRPGAGRPRLHGRAGLPAGRVLRPRLLRRRRARRPPSRCARTCPGCRSATRVLLSFRETAHGLKVLYDDGHLLELAVFAPEELALASRQPLPRPAGPG